LSPLGTGILSLIWFVESIWVIPLTVKCKA
jgi:hypothetical protein